ncbi:HSP20-like chaperone [Durotheca rogersii]|uniref:HSP20-like chaperone n=1 Tax=Durotheca rogersii TaxID=419775 RepID=UPI00221EA647|nr:HSP20-like chaperone [Durotheca rogersii]KAI5866455.1 HSP20-like chaperone [Durotheca rogersii]
MHHHTHALANRVRPHRIITKALTPITTTSLLNKSNFHTLNTMSMFGPRFYAPAEPNFTGLFRLIDDFDKYALQNNGTPAQQGGRHHGRHIQTFTPKFDLKETDDNYELHGELPGIEKDNVHIEFSDPQTIVVRGRVERTYTSGTPPPGLLEKGADEVSGALAEAPKEPQHDKAHQPTVEDEAEQGAAGKTVAQTKAQGEQQQQPKQPLQKFWVSERSVGEFSRTFQFPSRVEHDQVSASLDNGILSVVVPKAKKYEGRRITIN